MGKNYSKEKTDKFSNPPKIDLNNVIENLKKTKSINDYNILIKNRYNIYEMMFKSFFPKKKKEKTIEIKELNNSFQMNNINSNKNLFNNIIIKSTNKSFEENNSYGSYIEDISENKIFFKTNIKKLQKQKTEKIRKSYYEKLILKKNWIPIIKEQISQNFFFFDWDDTLMCTSYLSPNGIFIDKEINEKDIQMFNNLDQLVYNILKKSIKLGEVNIITNATLGWVEFSMRKYYPNSSKFLYDINIISARTLFEKKFPGDMKQWKILAFNNFLNKIPKNMLCNILCFGDSIIEIEAGHSLIMNLNNSFIKTIKFKEAPSPKELCQELDLINNELIKIFSTVKNLTIKVMKKKND